MMNSMAHTCVHCEGGGCTACNRTGVCGLESAQIGGATLYRADCIDVFPLLLNSVDAVITDPPYGAQTHTAKRQTRASIEVNADASLGFDQLSEDERKALTQFAVKKCSGWLLTFCEVEAVSAWRIAIEESGLKYRRTMAWVKPDASPQFNGQGPAQGYETIVASWCGSGQSRWNGGGKRGVFEYNATHGRYGGHPTEKPIALMMELVHLFSDAGSVVFDPFMGSGTTGVACVRQGRRFIGIEKCPKHFELAKKRIEEAQGQPDLFRKEAVMQPQKLF